MGARWATALVIMSVLGTGLVAIGIAAGGDQAPCTVPEGEEPTPNGTFCSEIRVTKTVTGEASKGTTFDVLVDCDEVQFNSLQGGEDPEGQVPPFEETLTFGRNGGTKSVYVFGFADCTISEDPPENCTLESIDPETLTIREVETYPVEVVNDCVAAALPLTEEPDFTG